MAAEQTSNPAHEREAWHAHVEAETKRRLELLRRIVDNNAQDVARAALLADTEQSLIAFVRDWVWSYDPRDKDLKVQPFAPWPEQESILRAVYAHEKARDNLFIDKSRDTGVTWLLAAYYVWRWLSVPMWAGSVGSRKAALLDAAWDHKSVFFKMRFVVGKLPDFLRPPGFDRNGRSRVYSAWARLQNPLNGSTITGEAGENQGRGGRSSIYFLDEFGTQPDAASVDAAVAGNSDCVVYATTATAPGTKAHEIRTSGSIDVVSISWASDKRKPENFRNEIIRKYTMAVWRREYDMDWTASSATAFIPNDWIQAAVNLNIHPAPGAEKTVGFDVADGGSAESVAIAREGCRVLHVLAWAEPDVVAGAHRAASLAASIGATTIRYDSIGVGSGAGGTMRARDDVKESGMKVIPVNVGESASKRKYDDDDREKTAKQRFVNLKAELWWQLRLRFWRTFDHVQNGTHYEPDELITIPNDSALIAQLSQPQVEHTSDGRTKVESKDDLVRRGVASPDRADALVLAYAETSGGIDWSLITHAAPPVASNQRNQVKPTRGSGLF